MQVRSLHDAGESLRERGFDAPDWLVRQEYDRLENQLRCGLYRLVTDQHMLTIEEALQRRNRGPAGHDSIVPAQRLASA